MQKESEKRGKLTNYIQKIGTFLCYALLILGGAGIIVPVALYNYMKHEVEIGNFGYEEEPINEKV